MINHPVYDNYEISGCHPLDDAGLPDPNGASVETCDDADARFWTLYGHIDGQDVEAIGDFARRDDAEQVLFRITGEPFTGSYQANPRLRLRHAAPELLAACVMIVTRWQRGDLAEAARACQSAIELATGGSPPWDITDALPGAGKPWSVLLLYPDYANESGADTFYGFVQAGDAIAAVAEAKRQAVAAQAGIEIDPDDFAPLLVTQGHRYSEPLFNK